MGSVLYFTLSTIISAISWLDHTVVPVQALQIKSHLSFINLRDILLSRASRTANDGLSFRSPNAAHTHPPPNPEQGPPPGPPGARSPGEPGPIEPMSVNRMNEMYMQQNQAMEDRLEADSRGYDSVFSQ